MKSIFKILTLILTLLFWGQNLLAQSLTQDSKKTYLRWQLSAEKEQLKINKSGTKVTIRTLDPDFFEKFSEGVAKITKNKNYHKNYKFIKPNVSGNPYELQIDLANNTIELFNFYQDETKSYVLDFWVNQDLVQTKKAASAPKKIKVAKLPIVKKVKPKKKSKQEKANELFDIKKISKLELLDPDDILNRIKGGKIRDFRYGAAFIWDYKALIPPLEEDINLKIKAPDYLYTIKDRTYLDDEKEAHIQLNINFYKKEQWGLMTRSIDLYEQKYGKDRHRNINDFMRATSMIKNTIKQKLKPEFLSQVGPDGEILPPNEFSKKGIFAAARNILTNIVDSTTEYELKKSILRYLIQHARDEDDYIQALNHSKSLYVSASEEFDDDMIIFSSRVILNSLAHLRQMDKIKSFLQNKAVMRVLPKQEGMAYIGYVNLSKGETDQVISNFKTKERSLVKPYHPSILFNTAEAYFRHAEYQKAVKLFDQFLKEYSRYSRSGDARLRVALSYDLLDREYKKVLRLYKDAINKSSDLKTRYEAKLRYVGLRVARNKKLDKQDKETIVFIDGDEGEKQRIDDNLKKLLWLVRLRTFLSTKQYDKALAYLASIPTEHLRAVDQRTFDAEGAEIVLGLIQANYLKEDYGRTVKVWEVYKGKYTDKVARNPYTSFIVSDSYLKLGLLDSYQRVVAELKTLAPDKVRRYPLWVDAHKEISIKDYIVELRINELMAQKKYKILKSFLDKNKTNKNINYNYYNGLVSNRLQKYNESVSSIESLLVNPNTKNTLTPKQNLSMLEAYLDSLYEVADAARFRKNTAALLNDLRRRRAKRYNTLITRADYLYIESLFSEKKVDFGLLKIKTKEFLGENKKVSYSPRVSFLNGVSLINDNEVEAGRKVLNSLINNEDTPEYLKGLAKTELSSLELKNRTL